MAAKIWIALQDESNSHIKTKALPSANAAITFQASSSWKRGLGAVQRFSPGTCPRSGT
jgi:hypothetical protein